MTYILFIVVMELFALRILWYHNDLRVGGAANSIVLARELASKGHSVIFASDTGNLVSELSGSGLEYIHIPYYQHGKHPSTKTIRELIRIARSNKIEVFWTINTVCTLEAYWAALFLNLPVFPLYGTPEIPVFRLPKIAEVGTNNPQVRDYLVEELGFEKQKTTVIRARIDTRTYRPMAVGAQVHQLWQFPKNMAAIGYVGRLASDKACSIRLFLAAAERLLPKYPSVCFVLVGDGELRDDILHRLDILNASIGRNCVVWAGEIPFSDIGAAINQLDIVCGMASTCIMSMACGRPTVVLGNGRFSEVLTPETVEALAHHHFNFHQLANQEQPETLVNQLVTLLNDPDYVLRLGQFGRQYAIDHYDVRKGAKELESVLFRLTAQSSYQLGPHPLPELLRSTLSLYRYRLRRRIMAGGSS